MEIESSCVASFFICHTLKTFALSSRNTELVKPSPKFWEARDWITILR